VGGFKAAELRTVNETAFTNISQFKAIELGSVQQRVIVSKVNSNSLSESRRPVSRRFVQGIYRREFKRVVEDALRTVVRY